MKLPLLFSSLKRLVFTAVLFVAPLSLKAANRDLDGDGKPNSIDSDVDNDGLENGRDRNVDGGRSRNGRTKGRYLGDRLTNGSKGELDIDADGDKDDSDLEDDIDGDRKHDDSRREDDIDGDGLDDDSLREDDIDGDGLEDDADEEDDIDGDGLDDDSIDEDDIDGDGLDDDSIDEEDTDGDGLNDDSTEEDDTDGDGFDDGIEDDDDDGDGFDDEDDTDDDGDGVEDEDEVVAIDPAVVGDGNAPAALTGISYEFAEGDDPETQILNFTSPTAGAKVEGVGTDAFTYVYAPSVTTAEVTVIYEPGDYDLFTFDFATGGFIRERYKDSLLERTRDGNFRILVP